MLWYPLLARTESRRLLKQLDEFEVDSWLSLRFCTGRMPKEGPGMTGCGIYVINPPWVLPERLKAVLPWLADALGSGSADFDLDAHVA